MNPDVLSAMITPAVLLSGCGTLILSTSNRLTRASDRVREVSDRVRRFHDSSVALSTAREDVEERLAEWRLVDRLLPKLIRRITHLHRSLIALYLAVELLVLTSLVIGGAGILGLSPGALPMWIGLSGVCAMSYAAALLTIEARLSLSANLAEMGALRELASRRAPH